MREDIKNRLTGAVRQFRHNSDNSPDTHNPREGFVFGYDRGEVDKLVGDLLGQLEAARAQQGEEPVAWSLRWPEDETVNAMTTFQTEDQARRYAGACQDGVTVVPLYTYSPNAQGVPEGWQQIVDCAQSLKRQHSLYDRDTVSVGLWKQDPDKPIFHAQFEFSLKDFVLSTAPPADKPEGEWVKCPEALQRDLVDAYENGDSADHYNVIRDLVYEAGLTRPAETDMGGEK